MSQIILPSPDQLARRGLDIALTLGSQPHVTAIGGHFSSAIQWLQGCVGEVGSLVMGLNGLNCVR